MGLLIFWKPLELTCCLDSYLCTGGMDLVVKEADCLEALELLSERLGLPSPQEEWQRYWDRIQGRHPGGDQRKGGQEHPGRPSSELGSDPQDPSGRPPSLQPLQQTRQALEETSEVLVPGGVIAINGGVRPTQGEDVPPSLTAGAAAVCPSPAPPSRPTAPLCGPPWFPPGSTHPLVQVEKGLREGCACQVQKGDSGALPVGARYGQWSKS